MHDSENDALSSMHFNRLLWLLLPIKHVPGVCSCGAYQYPACATAASGLHQALATVAAHEFAYSTPHSYGRIDRCNLFDQLRLPPRQ